MIMLLHLNLDVHPYRYLYEDLQTEEQNQPDQREQQIDFRLHRLLMTCSVLEGLLMEPGIKYVDSRHRFLRGLARCIRLGKHATYTYIENSYILALILATVAMLIVRSPSPSDQLPPRSNP